RNRSPEWTFGSTLAVSALALGLVALVLIPGCGRTESSSQVVAPDLSSVLSSAPAGTPAEFEKMDASNFGFRYMQNPIVADQMMEGKKFELTGVVLPSDKKDSDKLSLILGGGGTSVIRCYFRPDQEKAVASVATQKSVTIRCRCDGKQGDNIMLRECSIKE